jgi:hypothetical protein
MENPQALTIKPQVSNTALTLKLHASQLRAKLKNGNAPDSPLVEMLGHMTDDELVAQWQNNPFWHKR